MKQETEHKILERLDVILLFAEQFIDETNATEIEISAIPGLPTITENILNTIIGLLEITVPTYFDFADYKENIVIKDNCIYIEDELLLKKIK